MDQQAYSYCYWASQAIDSFFYNASAFTLNQKMRKDAGLRSLLPKQSTTLEEAVTNSG
jgi:hypothetical protein